MNATQGDLLIQNLLLVMNERNSTKRRVALESIYTNDITFFEVDEIAIGYDALNAIIGRILAKMPVNYVFHPLKPVTENHNVARLSWGVGPDQGPDVVTGTDIALFQNGRIQSLYVFLDTPEA